MSQTDEAEQGGASSAAAAAAGAAAATTAGTAAADSAASSSSASSVGAQSDAPSSEEDHEHLREQVMAQQRARRQKKQHDDWEAARHGFKALEEADNWRQLKHAVNFGRVSSEQGERIPTVACWTGRGIKTHRDIAPTYPPLRSLLQWGSTLAGQGMVGGRMRVHWDGVVGQMEEATHSLVYSSIFLEQVVRTHVNAAASLGVVGVWLQCE